jgi:tape measure domain-containing protein
MSTILGDLLLNLKLDSESFNTSLSAAKVAAMNAGREIETNLSKTKLNLKVNVDTTGVTEATNQIKEFIRASEAAKGAAPTGQVQQERPKSSADVPKPVNRLSTPTELGDLEQGIYEAITKGFNRARAEVSVSDFAVAETPTIDQQTLTPKVDDSALTALNEHLALKEQHWIQVWNLMDGNPLTPMVDDVALGGLNNLIGDQATAFEKLRSDLQANPLKLTIDTTALQDATADLQAFTQASKDANTAASNTRAQSVQSTATATTQPQRQTKASAGDTTALEKEIERAIMKGFKSAKAGNPLQGLIGTGFDIVTAPVRLVLNAGTDAIKSTLNGIVIGATQTLAGGLGKGLSTAIEASLGSIGGTEAIGEALGETLVSGIKMGLEGVDDIPKLVENAIQAIPQALEGILSKIGLGGISIPDAPFKKMARFAGEEAKAKIGEAQKGIGAVAEFGVDAIGTDRAREYELELRGQARQKRNARKPIVQEEAAFERRDAFREYEDEQLRIQKLQGVAQRQLRPLMLQERSAKQNVAQAQGALEALPADASPDDFNNAKGQVAIAQAKLQEVSGQRQFLQEYHPARIQALTKQKSAADQNVASAEARKVEIFSSGQEMTGAEEQEVMVLQEKIAKYEAISKKITGMLSGPRQKLDELKVKVNEARAQFDQVVSKTPQVYRQAIKDVTGTDIPDDKIPELIADPRLKGQGANASYNAHTNRVYVNQDTYDKIQNGTLQNMESGSLKHELVHGNQFDFGSAQGINAYKNNTPLTPLVEPTPELMRKHKDFLMQYVAAGKDPSELPIELDAEERAQQLVAKGAKQPRGKSLQAQVVGLQNIEDAKKALQESYKQTEGQEARLDRIGAEAPKSRKIIGNIKAQTAQIVELLMARKEMVDSLHELSDEDLDKFMGETATLKSKAQGNAAMMKQLFPQVTKGEVVGEIQTLKDNQAGQLIQAQPEKTPFQKVNEFVQKTVLNPDRNIDINMDAVKGFAYQAGNVAKGAQSIGQAALNSPVAKAIGGGAKAGLGFIGGAAQVGYKALEGVESVALDMLPMGRTAKAVGQKVVLPGLAFNAAANLLPGGHAIAGGLMDMASGAAAPMGQQLAGSLSGGAANFISHAVPNVMGLQGSLTGALSGAIDGAVNAGVAHIAQIGAAVLGGNVVAKGVAAPFKAIMPTSGQNKQAALPPAAQPFTPAFNPVKELEAVTVSAPAKIAPIAATLPPAPKTVEAIVQKPAAPLTELRSAKLNDLPTGVSDLASEATAFASEVKNNFKAAYTKAKQAFANGNFTEARGYLKTIGEMAKKAQADIGDYVAELGGTSEETNALNGLKGVIGNYSSNASKLSKKVDKKEMAMKSAAVPDELTDRRDSLGKEAFVAGAGYLGSQVIPGHIGGAIGGTVASVGARYGATVAEAGVTAHKQMSNDAVFQAASALERFKMMLNAVSAELGKKEVQEALGSELSGDLMGSLLGNSIPGVGGMGAAVLGTPQLVKMREAVKARIESTSGMIGGDAPELSAGLNQLGGGSDKVNKQAKDAQATLKRIEQELAKLEAHAKSLEDLDKALSDYEAQEVGKINLDEQFENLKVDPNKTQVAVDPKQVKRLEKEAAQIAKAPPKNAYDGVKEAINNIGGVSEKAAGGTGSLLGFAGGLKGIVLGFIGFQVLSNILPMMSSFIGKSFEAAKAVSNLNTAMQFASGSSVKAASDMKFIDKVVDDMGIPLASAREGFKDFAASTKDTALEGEPTRKLSDSMGKVTTVLGLTPEKASLANKALSQMASKGTVSMEELRGQLGDHIPGIINISARAMGVTTQELNKMVSSGSVTAEDFLPKLTRQLSTEFTPDAKSASQNMQSAENRMNNSMLRAQEKFGAANQQVMITVYNGLAAAINLASAAFDNMGRILTGVVAATGVLNPAIKMMAGTVLSGSGLMTAAMAAFQTSITAIGPAIMAAFRALGPLLMNALRMLGPMILQFIAIQAAIELVRTAFEMFTPDEQAKKFDAFGESATASLTKIGEAADIAAGKVNKISGPTDLKSKGFDLTLGLGDMLGMGSFKTDDVIKGMRNIPGFGGMRTVAENKFDEQKSSAAEFAVKAQAVAGNSLGGTFEDSSGKRISMSAQIGKVKAIDDQIKAIDLEKQKLELQPAPNKLAIEKLTKDKRALVKDREVQAAPITEQSAAVEAQIKNIKKALEEVDAMGLPADKAKELKDQLTPTLDILTKAQAQQDKYNRKLSEAVILAAQFGDNLEKAQNRRIDADLSVDKSSANQRAQLSKDELSGTKSKIEIEVKGALINASTADSKLANARAEADAIRKANSSINAQNTLTQIGVKPTDGVATLKALGEKSTDPKAKDAIKGQVAIKEAEQNIANLEQQTNEAAAAAQRTIKDSSKQAADYYRSVARQNEDIALTIKSLNLGAAMTESKNRIKTAMTGFHDTFVGEFVGKIVEVMEMSTQMTKNTIEATGQIMQAIRAANDQQRTGLEALNQPTGTPGMDGSTAGFEVGDYRVIPTGTLAGQEYGASRDGGSRQHAGQDLDIGENDSFQSYIGGTVTGMGDDPGGYFKWIDIYNAKLKRVERIAEMDNFNVKVGDQVKPGQVVGKGVNDTGVVHYEIRSDFDAQGKAGFGKQGTEDPIKYLEGLGLLKRQGSQLIPTGKVNKGVAMSDGHTEDDGHDHGGMTKQPIKPQSIANGESMVKVTRTGKKDQFGGEVLNVQNIVKGKVVDSVQAASGDPTNQKFESLGSTTQAAGSRAPIPAGTYKLDAPEVGNFGADAAKLGKTWIGIKDANTGSDTISGTKNRGNFGLHEDADRFTGGAGSAGCVVFYDPSAISKVAGWVQGGQRKLVVDYSSPTGTVAQGANKAQQQATQVARSAGTAFNLDALFNGGSNSIAAKVIGMSEGNRTASGGFTKSASGHTDPGNDAANIGSFSAQGRLNKGSVEASDRAVIEEDLKPSLSKLQAAATAAGVQVTPKLMMNFLDMVVQSPAAAMGWNDSSGKGKGFLGNISQLKGRENDDAAINEVRTEAYRSNTGKLETSFSGKARLSEDQYRRMKELNQGLSIYGGKLGGGGAGQFVPPTTGVSNQFVNLQQSALDGGVDVAASNALLSKGVNEAGSTLNDNVAAIQRNLEATNAGLAADQFKTLNKARKDLRYSVSDETQRNNVLELENKIEQNDLGPATAAKSFKKEQLQLEKARMEFNFTNGRDREKSAAQEKDTEQGITVLEGLVSAGGPGAAMAAEGLKTLKELLPKIKSNNEKLKNASANRNKVFDLKAKDIQEKYDLVIEAEKLAADTQRVESTNKQRALDSAAALKRGDFTGAQNLDKAAFDDQSDITYRTETAKVREDKRAGKISEEQALEMIANIGKARDKATVAFDDEQQFKSGEFKFGNRQQLLGSQQSLSKATSEAQRLGGDAMGALDTDFAAQLNQASFDYDSQIRSLDALTRSGQINADTAAQMRANYEALNQVNLSNIQQQAAKLKDDLKFESGQQLLGSRVNLAKANTEWMSYSGNTAGAKEQDKQIALANVKMDLSAQTRSIDAAVKSGKLLSATAVEMKKNLADLNKVQVANIENQFNPYKVMEGKAITGLKGGIQDMLKSAFSGDGIDWEAFTSKIADMGANLLSEHITEQLFGNLKGVKGADELTAGLDLEGMDAPTSIVDAGQQFSSTIVEAANTFANTINGGSSGTGDTAATGYTDRTYNPEVSILPQTIDAPDSAFNKANLLTPSELPPLAKYSSRGTFNSALEPIALGKVTPAKFNESAKMAVSKAADLKLSPANLDKAVNALDNIPNVYGKQNDKKLDGFSVSTESIGLKNTDVANKPVDEFYQNPIFGGNFQQSGVIDAAIQPIEPKAVNIEAPKVEFADVPKLELPDIKPLSGGTQKLNALDSIANAPGLADLPTFDPLAKGAQLKPADFDFAARGFDNPKPDFAVPDFNPTKLAQQAENNAIAFTRPNPQGTQPYFAAPTPGPFGKGVQKLGALDSIANAPGLVGTPQFNPAGKFALDDSVKLGTDKAVAIAKTPAPITPPKLAATQVQSPEIAQQILSQKADAVTAGNGTPIDAGKSFASIVVQAGRDFANAINGKGVASPETAATTTDVKSAVAATQGVASDAKDVVTASTEVIKETQAAGFKDSTFNSEVSMLPKMIDQPDTPWNKANLLTPPKVTKYSEGVKNAGVDAISLSKTIAPVFNDKGKMAVSKAADLKLQPANLDKAVKALDKIPEVYGKEPNVALDGFELSKESLGLKDTDVASKATNELFNNPLLTGATTPTIEPEAVHIKAPKLEVPDITAPKIEIPDAKALNIGTQKLNALDSIANNPIADIPTFDPGSVANLKPADLSFATPKQPAIAAPKAVDPKGQYAIADGGIKLGEKLGEKAGEKLAKPLTPFTKELQKFDGLDSIANAPGLANTPQFNPEGRFAVDDAVKFAVIGKDDKDDKVKPIAPLTGKTQASPALDAIQKTAIKPEVFNPTGKFAVDDSVKLGKAAEKEAKEYVAPLTGKTQANATLDAIQKNKTNAALFDKDAKFGLGDLQFSKSDTTPGGIGIKQDQAQIAVANATKAAAQATATQAIAPTANGEVTGTPTDAGKSFASIVVQAGRDFAAAVGKGGPSGQVGDAVANAVESTGIPELAQNAAVSTEGLNVKEADLTKIKAPELPGYNGALTKNAALDDILKGGAVGAIANPFEVGGKTTIAKDGLALSPKGADLTKIKPTAIAPLSGVTAKLDTSALAVKAVVDAPKTIAATAKNAVVGSLGLGTAAVAGTVKPAIAPPVAAPITEAIKPITTAVKPVLEAAKPIAAVVKPIGDVVKPIAAAVAPIAAIKPAEAIAPMKAPLAELAKTPIKTAEALKPIAKPLDAVKQTLPSFGAFSGSTAKLTGLNVPPAIVAAPVKVAETAIKTVAKPLDAIKPVLGGLTTATLPKFDSMPLPGAIGSTPLPPFAAEDKTPAVPDLMKLLQPKLAATPTFNPAASGGGGFATMKIDGSGLTAGVNAGVKNLQSGVALAAQTFSNSGAKAGNGLMDSLQQLPSLLSGVTGGGGGAAAPSGGIAAKGGGILGTVGSLFGGGGGRSNAIGDSAPSFGFGGSGGLNFGGGSFSAPQSGGGGGSLASSLLQSFTQPKGGGLFGGGIGGGGNFLSNILGGGAKAVAPAIVPQLPTGGGGGLLGGLLTPKAGGGMSFGGAFTGATARLNTTGFGGTAAAAKTGGGLFGGFGGFATIAMTALPLIMGLFKKKDKKPNGPDDKPIARIGVNTFGYRKKGGEWVQDKLLVPEWDKLNAKYRSEAVGNYSEGNMQEVVRNFDQGGMVNVPNFMMGGSLEPKSIIPRKPSINAPMKVRGFAGGNLKELSNNVPNFADGSLKGMSGGGPKVQRSFMRGVPSPETLEAALKKEGSQGVVSVLQPSELVLSPKQTAKFFSMGMDRQLSSNTPNYNLGNKVPSFNSGGMVGYTPNFAAGGLVGGNTSNSLSVDVPINISGGGEGGGSKADAAELRSMLDAKIRQVINVESRPGGSLGRFFQK